MHTFCHHHSILKMSIFEAVNALNFMQNDISTYSKVGGALNNGNFNNGNSCGKRRKRQARSSSNIIGQRLSSKIIVKYYCQRLSSNTVIKDYHQTLLSKIIIKRQVSMKDNHQRRAVDHLYLETVLFYHVANNSLNTVKPPNFSF